MAIIGANACCVTCKLKKDRVFTIFMRDLEYQVEKEAKLKTNLRTVISLEYYNLLDIFLKKDLNISPLIKNMIIKSY